MSHLQNAGRTVSPNSKVAIEAQPDQTPTSSTSAEPRAIPMFQKEVRCFNYRELMADALCYMRDHEYSQIVVRWRGNIRLLSGEGIVKWITDLLDHGEDHIARRAVG